jgi:hypothetical protein
MDSVVVTRRADSDFVDSVSDARLHLVRSQESCSRRREEADASASLPRRLREFLNCSRNFHDLGAGDVAGQV